MNALKIMGELGHIQKEISGELATLQAAGPKLEGVMQGVDPNVIKQAVADAIVSETKGKVTAAQALALVEEGIEVEKAMASIVTKLGALLK